jgi:hypothetical protein
VAHPIFDGLEKAVAVSVTHYDKESSLRDARVESSDAAAFAAITAAADERKDRERAHRNYSNGSRHHGYAHS